MYSEPIIKATNLSCLSGSQFLLNNISWQIQKGDQWVVFGRNGCGKTTLLSIIAGYRRYTAGDLEVFGKCYTAENILEIRKRIGWISSSFFDKYYQKESALDIVLSALSATLGVPFDITNKQISRAKDLLTAFRLKDRMHFPFELLSKGERQQVLIARAFMTAPEVLILDEPGTGLDVLAREQLLSTIKQMVQEQEMTLIYVTHYPEEILPFFTKTILLRNGTIYKIGRTSELFTSEVMSDFFSYPVVMDYANGRYNFSIAPEAENIFAKLRVKEGARHVGEEKRN